MCRPTQTMSAPPTSTWTTPKLERIHSYSITVEISDDDSGSAGVGSSIPLPAKQPAKRSSKKASASTRRAFNFRALPPLFAE